MSVPRARLLDLMKVQCRIFASTYNPDGLRLGNKVLRQRLKGPAVSAYYPRRVGTFKELERAFIDTVEMEDPKEEYRLESIRLAKARGKGAPKKKRTAAESRAFKGKKR